MARVFKTFQNGRSGGSKKKKEVGGEELREKLNRNKLKLGGCLVDVEGEREIENNKNFCSIYLTEKR